MGLRSSSKFAERIRGKEREQPQPLVTGLMKRLGFGRRMDAGEADGCWCGRWVQVRWAAKRPLQLSKGLMERYCKKQLPPKQLGFELILDKEAIPEYGL